MLNNVMLVGRLLNEVADDVLELSVNRVNKNEDGIYESDIIPMIVWEGITKQMKEYCKKGDLIGVRGRLETRDDKVVVIGEKVTFLSSNKEALKENGVE